MIDMVAVKRLQWITVSFLTVCIGNSGAAYASLQDEGSLVGQMCTQERVIDLCDDRGWNSPGCRDLRPETGREGRRHLGSPRISNEVHLVAADERRRLQISRRENFNHYFYLLFSANIRNTRAMDRAGDVVDTACANADGNGSNTNYIYWGGYMLPVRDADNAVCTNRGRDAMAAYLQDNYDFQYADSVLDLVTEMPDYSRPGTAPPSIAILHTRAPLPETSAALSDVTKTYVTGQPAGTLRPVVDAVRAQGMNLIDMSDYNTDELDASFASLKTLQKSLTMVKVCGVEATIDLDLDDHFFQTPFYEKVFSTIFSFGYNLLKD